MNKSILSGLGAAALWGSSNVLAKGLLSNHFEPMSFLLAEFIGSSIVLWGLILFQQKALVIDSSAIRYSLLGLLQPGLAFILGAYGLSLTTANSDALVWSAETIVIIIFSWLVFRERIGWLIISLAVLGTIGTILATAPNVDYAQTPNMVLGNWLIFAAVFCAAAYTVVSQHQLIKIEPLFLMTLHQTSSLILILAIWFIGLPYLHPFDKGTNLIECLLAVLCGVAQFALPFWLYLKAIKGLGAARTSIFLILPPVFTITGSFIFLGERLSWLQWIGAILALGAVAALCLLKTEEAPVSASVTGQLDTSI